MFSESRILHSPMRNADVCVSVCVCERALSDV